MKANDINTMWKNGNDLGRGYHACNRGEYGEFGCKCGCDINELHHLGELVIPAGASNDALALYRKECGTLVAVGDSHGPWAVDIEGAR